MSKFIVKKIRPRLTSRRRELASGPGVGWMNGRRTTSLKMSMKMQWRRREANMFLWMAMRGTRRTLKTFGKVNF